MYASDYVLSLGSSAIALEGTHNNINKLKTGWLHYTNDWNSSYEWNLAYGGASKTYYDAWYVYSSGDFGGSSIPNLFGVSPVFYLTSDIYKEGGSGTYTDPYIITK